ncbi:MAG TPA: hypothetical protein PLM98_12685, partial [Thiolinea sp.]|nr:hypothetical protein [Thiolinea sp.]
MSELALQLIREAKEQRLTRLDLGRCGLTEIPEAVFELVWLEELILSNSWYELDKVEGRWSEYKSTNQGKENLIISLPKGFERLGRLTKLIASGSFNNKWQISDLSSLSSLTELVQLYLSSNQISELSALSVLS